MRSITPVILGYLGTLRLSLRRFENDYLRRNFKPVCWLVPKLGRRMLTGEGMLLFWVFCPVFMCFSDGIV